MDPSLLDELFFASPLCRGCLTPVGIGRFLWCSKRCENFVRAHRNDFMRLFRLCRGCEVEIDHRPVDTKFCSAACCWRWRAPVRFVSCGTCHADLPEARRRSAYCSTRCGNIARGVVRAEPFPRRRCALPECGVEFQPHLTAQRCCSEKHGKLLYNRESRADGRQKPDLGMIAAGTTTTVAGPRRRPHPQASL